MPDDVTARAVIRGWLERQGLLGSDLAEAAAASLEHELRLWLRTTPYVPLAERWAMDEGPFEVVRRADRRDMTTPPDAEDDR
ncbi:hypothetical protein ACI8AA_01175 [Geodermatophilus sp. SYSU D01180]